MFTRCLILVLNDKEKYANISKLLSVGTYNKLKVSRSPPTPAP